MSAEYRPDARGYMRLYRSPEERVWEKVDKSGECWVWTASRNPSGYGRVRHEGEARLAHRVTYELAHGPIPDGLCVLHRCDNPPCVRPSHLFLGTRAENTADMLAKGREPHVRNERSGKVKLTNAEVAEIRAAVAAGAMQKDVAAAYGVHGAHVSRICSEKRRPHEEVAS